MYQLVPELPSYTNLMEDKESAQSLRGSPTVNRERDNASKVCSVGERVGLRSLACARQARTSVRAPPALLPRVAQVIILSHSKPFLCQTWESSDPTQRAALQVRRNGPTSSTIDAWNVDADLVTEYDRRHEKLRALLNGAAGNLRDIAVDIRPMLEHFCRVAYTAGYAPKCGE
jgi:hypothetical protein